MAGGVKGSAWLGVVDKNMVRRVGDMAWDRAARRMVVTEWHSSSRLLKGLLCRGLVMLSASCKSRRWENAPP